MALILILAEVVIGGMLIIGAYTQIAALGAMALSIKLLISRGPLPSALPPKLFYCLLLGISISLFITGAGLFAVDLPI